MNIKISTAQFENKSGDKDYNLGVIEKLVQKASNEGSDMIAFHECSITGYTFARNLSKDQMLDIADPIPDGESIKSYIKLQNSIILLFWQDFLKKMKITISSKLMYV